MTEETMQAIREAQREYKRQWNKRNPGKNREYQLRYWEKKAALKAKEIENGRTKKENHKRNGA